MAKPLMDIVLPRLARPLYHHLEDFQVGRLTEAEFTHRFERLLRRQHDWLSRRGVGAPRAAIAIHAAVIVLSLPGLRSEAAEANLPLEVVEYRAIRDAAQDVASSYQLPEADVVRAIVRLVTKYAS